METATDVTAAIHKKEKDENGWRSVTCIMQNFITMYELHAVHNVLCESKMLERSS